MRELDKLSEKVFRISSSEEFNAVCLEVFRIQAEENSVYKEYLSYLNIRPEMIDDVGDIPFLPIDLFKSRTVTTGEPSSSFLEFTSSGTTGMRPSRHVVLRPEIYEESFLKGFELFYGKPSDYRILALLPSYLERQGSSLIYMTNRLIKLSAHQESGFFLSDTEKLRQLLASPSSKKTLLLGVSFALLDLVEKDGLLTDNTVVMETGGMKGRRKEMTRFELHDILKKGFGVSSIHSEYGMTELLSQAYSSGHGLFRCPPWMRIVIRDIQDPLSPPPSGRSGVINIVDLANLYSCSFIGTSDLGKMHSDGAFEVLGRLDYSDMRGCNLMVSVS